MKIKNPSRKRSHKDDGIGVRKIRTFPFLLPTPAIWFSLGHKRNVSGIGTLFALNHKLYASDSLRASSPIWASEASREGPAKGELATIPYKFSFVLRPDEGKYHWLKNDVPEIKVD